jgi:hypothetical protein
LIFGLVEELEGLVLRLFEEVGDGEELIVEGDDLVFLAVLELKREDVECFLGLGVEVRVIVYFISNHLLEFLLRWLLDHLGRVCFTKLLIALEMT